MSQLSIKIENCNNIDSAEILLTENKLNIKFGSNGTGKSTIATAIASDNQSLETLMPFKLRQDNPESKSPLVSGIDSISEVMCFNEEYVNQIVFRQDELIKDSFSIFIQTPSYKDKTEQIQSIVSGIKQVFAENADLEAFLTDLKTLSSNIKLTSTGSISKASPAYKGLGSGNKLVHIPEGLETYSAFLRNSNNVSWIDWQMRGQSFLDISDDCPFCTAHVADKKEQIKKVSEEYDKTAIKHLSGLIEILDKLGHYFTDDANAILDIIKTLSDGLNSQHLEFLVSVKNQIDDLISRLENLKVLSSVHFGLGETVAEKLPEYKIDLTFFDRLNSDRTNELVESLNASLDDVINRAGTLQGQINLQRIEVTQLIERHQKGINQFLSNAGYRYHVFIESADDRYQLKLRHKDFADNISRGNQHFSFGERNAFALVLFMYECLSREPDLIILDDPISSFDKSKKYAIMDMLFRQNQSLKGKTVLVLTHDIEPIIDTVKSVRGLFNNQVDASFLRQNRGVITEIGITRNDILTFSQICDSVLASEKSPLVKLVYLRRLYEIVDDKGDAYQVLSNLFHKRPIAEATDSRIPTIAGGVNSISPDEFDCGVAIIEAKFGTFDYQQELDDICNNSHITQRYNECDNAYEKLQIFRILNSDHSNSIIRKFINESYHIENELICQLAPSKFNTIPQYVIDECDNHMEQTAIETAV
ncbi:AAA family ATPase [Rubritalea profundi]|uniref:AAA family ATPase n=1 Tax=Rubritalea profundi TaxID=1658618 RepID=A0A2S7TXG0_9BACT|nr:AAA family ATPase [Rubritalea profundi]PQJ27445.1 AAA family ATPase [Rubritalea profundi]